MQKKIVLSLFIILTLSLAGCTGQPPASSPQEGFSADHLSRTGQSSDTSLQGMSEASDAGYAEQSSEMSLQDISEASNTDCAGQASESPHSVTFTDDLSRSVTVNRPQRVAALLGSFAQTWVLAGGNVCASADDAWEDFDLALPEDAVNLGMTKNLSLEKLLAAEPDFVIASTNTSQQLQWQDTLEQSGIPVAYFDVSGFEDYLRMLKICTDITGRSDLYQENGLNVQTQVESVIAESRKRLEEEAAPSVLFLRASASSIRAKNNSGNVLGEMLAALGCENIADSDDSLLENLSMERILQADPDFIFFVQSGDDTTGMEENVRRFLAENPAWEQLSAVKEDRVFFLDKTLYNLKPNNRWGEAYENLEAILSGE